MVKFKDFSRPLSVFQVFFKANFIFKDFKTVLYIQVLYKPVRTLPVYLKFTSLSMVFSLPLHQPILFFAKIFAAVSLSLNIKIFQKRMQLLRFIEKIFAFS